MQHHDDQMLWRSLLLARAWAGRCWPNPTVGACVVTGDGWVGDGVHRGPGTRHAEVAAIEAAQAAGRTLSASTLYVSLEPCNHHGRTAPCSEAILAARIPRVVYACADTNPRVEGGGAARLRSAGVVVERASAAVQGLARELNHPYFEAEWGARPHVTLKLATDLEGRLARSIGRVDDPRLRAITGERAQRRVHRMRNSSSCVVVGRGTVEADRPRLNVRRIQPTHQPRAVVLDSRLSSAVEDLPAASLLFCGTAAVARSTRYADAGHECVPLAAGPRDWMSVFSELSARGLGIVLVEGGAEVAHSLLAAGMLDRLHLFLAPHRVGGDGPRLDFLAGLGLTPSGPPRESRIHLAGLDLQLGRRRRVGDDWEWVLRR
jgi:diaminohydroxyphosphoribosylaminopyrimidine deaminase/5-amino-6-(5-phosphoribosylamino)uracil reductase